MTEADIGMTEHRSKNTLGRSVPVKTKTDVEEDGTSEDGSPRPVCNMRLKCSMSVDAPSPKYKSNSVNLNDIVYFHCAG